MEFKIEKRNWKLIDVEHFDGESSGRGYGSIFTGEKRDQILFWFDYDIDIRSFDGDGCFERVDVKIYDVEHDDPSRCWKIQLNDRNIKLICETIECGIAENPESFGIDFEKYDDELVWNNDEPTIWNTIYSGYPSRIHCDKF
jgi:hypothetical protein